MGFAIANAIGQHPNDRELSFYVASPSGFEVELGWNPIVVTEEAKRVAARALPGHQPVGPLPREPDAGRASSARWAADWCRSRARNTPWEARTMNAAHEQFDVVIVGLGPTGLTLAHCLGQRGLQVLVLEREPQFYGNARAVYTDGECMRIFQSFGMAERLAADMLQDAPVQMVLPDGSVLFQLKNTQRPHGWPANNFFYQPLLETALADGLARYPERHACCAAAKSRASSRMRAASTCSTSPAKAGLLRGRPRSRRARRRPLPGEAARARPLPGRRRRRAQRRAHAARHRMAGKNFPNPWLVVDIKAKDPADGLRHLPYFNFICDPACPTVSCVQPNGHHRFEFMLMPGQTREHMEHPDTVRALPVASTSTSTSSRSCARWSTPSTR